jgi:cytochrome c biogenesis protein CcmG/thiol:disulfide interchange protein DsbE
MSNLTPLPASSEAAETAIADAAPIQRGRVLLWQAAIVGVLLLFLGFLAWGLWRTNVDGKRAAGIAPDFTITTFEGEQLSLGDLRGKGVVVNFWASWCDPCRDEAPLLEQAWRREEANGIVFVGLDYLDQEPAALAFMDEYDITYPSGPDIASQAARRYGILGVPETFFIDAEGNIAGQFTGPITDAVSLDDMLARIRP